MTFDWQELAALVAAALVGWLARQLDAWRWPRTKVDKETDR